MFNLISHNIEDNQNSICSSSRRKLNDQSLQLVTPEPKRRLFSGERSPESHVDKLRKKLFHSVSSQKAREPLFNNIIDRLPISDLIRVFLFLQQRELIEEIQLVSRRFNLAANSGYLWEQPFIDETNFSLLYFRKKRLVCKRRTKGTIFHAEHRGNNQMYTIRRLDLKIANGNHFDGLLTPVLREACIGSRFHHTGIKRHTTICYQDNYMLFVQPTSLLTFSDLIAVRRLKSQYFRNNNSLMCKEELCELKNLICQLLDALKLLDIACIVHRNLTPWNIAVNMNPLRIEIMDFFKARKNHFHFSQNTPFPKFHRTLGGRESQALKYKAPELFLRDDKINMNIDMWSVGLMIAEYALGQPFFNVETEYQLLHSIFSILGVPANCAITMPDWKMLDLKKLSLPINHPDREFIVEELIRRGAQEYLIKLVALKNIMGDTGYDFIVSCLLLNPDNRLSPYQALYHPFINEGDMIQEKMRKQNETSHPLYRELNRIDYYLKIEEQRLAILSNQQNPLPYRESLAFWIYEIGTVTSLKAESVLAAIQLFDIYSILREKTPYKESNLPAICIACMKLSSYLNEVSMEYYKLSLSQDFCKVVNMEHIEQEIINTEKNIVETTKYNLHSPTPYCFLRMISDLLDVALSQNHQSLVFQDDIPILYRSLRDEIHSWTLAVIQVFYLDSESPQINSYLIAVSVAYLVMRGLGVVLHHEFWLRLKLPEYLIPKHNQFVKCCKSIILKWEEIKFRASNSSNETPIHFLNSMKHKFDSISLIMKDGDWWFGTNI